MNSFEEQSSHYEVLELTPDATPQEIRSAYLRLKSAYGKENIAHYTLFSREETEAMLQKIENAYIILSNPEKRRAYDQAQGLSTVTPAAYSNQAPVDFAASAYGLNIESTSLTANASSSAFFEPVQPQVVQSQSIPSQNSNFDVDTLIQAEQEWSGAFLRKIREAKRMSLEDLSDYTRISRSYLGAIEEENYNKLPAVVYVRGFLQQIAKRLKLPPEQLTQKYLDRIKVVRDKQA